MDEKTVHVPVLLKETVAALSPKAGGIYVDCTLGGGGHAEALLQEAMVRLVGIDADPQALLRTAPRLKKWEKHITLLASNFRHIKQVLKDAKIEHVDGILFDLGLSSDELEQSGRGFSFMRDEPLHMGFDPSQRLTAADLIEHLSAPELAGILRTYSEERYAMRIANAIVARRKTRPITTTFDLRDTILSAVPSVYAKGKINPATKTFQALRMAANDELDALREGLKGAWDALLPQGRLAVISFHSLEDRIVKNFMRDLVKEGKASLLTKKPIGPGNEEIAQNPRARSAKLRVAIKIS